MPFDPVTGRYISPDSDLRNRYDLERTGKPGGFFDGIKVFDMGDLAAAPFRGLEGFARGTIGLVDVLPGVDTNIAENRFLGRSESLVGGLLEGFTQILIPFGATHRAISAAGFLASKASTARGALAATGATKAGLAAAGKVVLRGATAGSVADFVAFGAHEERLSNLIQRFPGLQNPVTEFLAAEGDDNEILGRMKNVLEGAGLGVLFDAIPAVLAGVRAKNAAVAAGKSTEEVAEATAKALNKAGTPEKASDVLDRVHQDAEQVRLEAAREEGVTFDPEERLSAQRPADLPERAPEEIPGPEKPEAPVELEPGRFHGGAAELEIDEGHYATKNIYGQGLYTSTDADVAQRYGKSRGGVVHRVEEVGEINAFDLDGPIPDWMREDPDDLVHLALAGGIEGGPPKTVKDLYQNIRDLSEGEGVSADEVQNILDSFRANMEERGFNAIDVVGKRDKGVRIYFDPSVVKTSQVDVEAGAAPRQEIPGRAGEAEEPPTPGEAGAAPRVPGDPAERIPDLTEEDPIGGSVVPEAAEPRTFDEALERQQRIDDETRGVARVVGERLELADMVARGVDVSGTVVARLGMGQQQVERGLVLFEELVATNAGELRARLGRDPKDLSASTRALYGLANSGVVDLRSLAGDNPDSIVLVRAFERFLEEQNIPLRLPKETEEQMVLGSVAITQDLLGMEVGDALHLIDAHVKGTENVGRFSLALDMAISSHASRVVRLMSVAREGLSDVDPEDLARLGVTDGMGPDDVLKMAYDEYRRYVGFVEGLSRGRSNIGRALRTAQVPVSARIAKAAGLTTGIDNIDQLRLALGDAEWNRRMDTIVAAGKFDPMTQKAAIQRLKEMPFTRRVTHFTTDWVINALLHSPKTLFTNFIFPFTTAFYVPFENMVGGALTANGKLISRELRIMGGMMTGMVNATRFAKRALKEGPGIDPRYGRFEHLPKQNMPGVMSSEVMSDVFGSAWGPETILGHTVDRLGKFFSFPNTFMNSSDEFNKAFVAHGMAQAMLTEEALTRGVDVSQFVAENMDNLFKNGQLMSQQRIKAEAVARMQEEGITDTVTAQRRITELETTIRDESNFDLLNPMTTEILRRAREVTATGPLEDKTVGRSVQQFVENHPMMRLVLPFIRTPVNLAKFAGQRTPLEGIMSVSTVWYRKIRGGPLQLKALEDSRLRNVRDLSSADPEVRSAAVGRIATGTGIFTAALMAANSGLITGAGPTDPERRRVLMDAGWLPYSFNTGEGYTQYLRADPFSIMLGLTADMMEASRLAFTEEQDSFDAMTVGLITSISNNLTNRTYMAGLRSFLDAMTRSERFGGQFVAGITAAFVPRSFQQAKSIIADPVLRDVHDIGSRLRTRLPFMGSAAPLRNMLGEPVERVRSLGAKNDVASRWLDMIVPIAYRETTDDLIRTELASLQHGFAPPRRTRFGINLSDVVNTSGRQAYDRWAELHGKVKIGGRTLRQELKRLIRSRKYQSLPPESTVFEESPRVRLIRSLVTQYREKAFDETLREFPSLSSKIQTRRSDATKLRLGQRPSQAPPEIPQPYGAFAR